MDRDTMRRISVYSAVLELMRKKPFDSIGVTEICKEASISKATFYRLFSCKYSISQWLIGIYSAEGLDEIGRSLSWHEGIYHTTVGLSKHKVFLDSANKTQVAMESPQELTYLRRRGVLVETLTKWKRIDVSDRIFFQVDAFSLLSAQIASRWHRNLLPYTLDDYVNMLESIVPHELHELLDEPTILDKELNPDGNVSASPTHLTKTMLDALSI